MKNTLRMIAMMFALLMMLSTPVVDIVYPVMAQNQPRGAAAPPASENIVVAPSIVNYQTMKDNYGKRTAERSVAVQITVVNNDPVQSFQFFGAVADFDPTQCASVQKLWPNYNVLRCEQVYTQYFGSPFAIAPKDMLQVTAEAQVGVIQSTRAKVFRGLDAVVTVGGGLSGFNLMGTTGRAVLGVVAATGIPALQNLFPDLSPAQLQRLQEQGTQPVLIAPNSAQTFVIFIPASQIFSKDSWAMYVGSAQTQTPEALEFKKAMQLFVTVTIQGAKITTSEPITVKSNIQ